MSPPFSSKVCGLWKLSQMKSEPLSCRCATCLNVQKALTWHERIRGGVLALLMPVVEYAGYCAGALMSNGTELWLRLKARRGE